MSDLVKVHDPEIVDLNSLWKIDAAKTQDHWLEVVDPEGWWKASVKWDGCIHFTRYFNIPYEDGQDRTKDEQATEDYIHICDLDDYIRRLQALRFMADKHFKKDANQ